MGELRSYRSHRRVALKVAAFLLTGALLAATGCASKPSLVETRAAPTGLAPGEKASVILLRYIRSGSDNTDWQSTEQALANCLQQNMSAESGTVTPVPADRIREFIRSADPAGGTPLSAEAMLDILAKEEASRQLSTAGVRYLVLLEGSLTTTESEWDGHGGRGGIIVVRSWKKISILEATIVDVNNHRISGRLRTSSEGQEAAGVGLAFGGIKAQLTEPAPAT